MLFSSLQNIKNPLLRSITAGVTASAIVTLLSGIVIGFAAPKNEPAHKLAVYLSLLSFAGGTALAMASGSKQTAPPASPEWQGERDFLVTRKTPESQEITSFYLKPQDGQPLPAYKPGQFLTIKLNIPGQNRPVIRTYSISDYTTEYYRLSIKRESAPPGLEVPPGVASNFLHDQVEVGTVITAKPPTGKFYLDLSQSQPIVLISNGVGITPMIAMAKAATLHNPQRQVWFFHGARNGDYHAFKEEIADLVKHNSNLHVHYRYSRPKPQEEGLYPSQGYVDISLIQNLVAPELQRLNNLEQAQYFLCGSPAFMDSLQEGLRVWGVEDRRILSEAFGPSSRTPAPAIVKDGKKAEITFSRSQKTLTWTPEDGTILEFAEAHGLNPSYSCRSGICLTCMCQLVQGEVEYQQPPTGTPEEGTVLICISTPKTEQLVLDL